MPDLNTALLASVARLYYLDGLGQSEIASIYGVSRSTVSRLLTSARERGVVRISVDDYDPRDRILESQLRDRFGLRHAIVVRGMDESEAANRRAVGYFAMPEVAEWIGASNIVGITGGRTLGELVRAMRPEPPRDSLAVVQLMGTIGASPSSVDASELCRSLARRFQGDFHTVSAPAFAADWRTRDLFLSHSQIQSVRALFSSLDLTLIGIGTMEESMIAERRVLSSVDVNELREAGAVGEVCGRFFDASGRECATPMRDRVISIDLDVLRTGRHVVAVTTGGARSGAIRAAIAGGLLHSLVIDGAGAAAILSAL